MDVASFDLAFLRSYEGATKAVATLTAALLTICLLKVAGALQRYIRRQLVMASVPRAPGALPLIGHVVTLLKAPARMKGAWDVMEEWLNDGNTDIVQFKILGTHGIVVRGPEALKRIFQLRFKTYMKDLVVSYHPFLPILGTGLVTADGELWQKQRLLMAPALRVDILDDIIYIAKKAVDRLSEKLEGLRGTGEAIDIEEEFRLLTLQVIGEAILSMQPEDCDRVFPSLYLPVMEEANKRVLRPYRKYLPTPEWFRFRRRMATLNAFLVGLLRQRWADRQAGRQDDSRRPDILDRVLQATEAAGTKWDTSLEEQLCYEIKTFLLAGHETSAAMLTWSTYELSQSSEARQRVVKEATEAFGADGNGEAVRPAVEAMQYTLGVLKEALRKYTVVPVVTRNLAADDELLGHKLPAGIMIACHLHATHQQWKEPQQFRPERFLEGGEYDQFDEAVRPYMFVPFIQGPRNCLGQHLALLEARVVLALLHKRFSFRMAEPRQLDRHPTVIPLSPVGGLKVLVE